MRPFFSRRIGNVDNNAVKVLFGARLSGNINKDWRVGLMSIQTNGDENLFARANNYSVGALQRKIFHSSNITGFFINRQAIREYFAYKNDYNRIAGIEYDLRTKDSKWNGKAFFHHAFTPEAYTNSNAWSAKLRYRTTKATLFAGVDHVDENYISDIGFVPRLYHTDEATDSTIRVGYTQFRMNGHYRFFAAKCSWLQQV